MPTFASVNGHGGHLDRTVAVVYDLRACCRGDSAIGANGDRKDRGNGPDRLRELAEPPEVSLVLAALATQSRDRDMHRAIARDRKRFAVFFIVNLLQIVRFLYWLRLDSNGYDSPGGAEDSACLWVQAVEHGGTLVGTGGQLDIQLGGRDLAADCDGGGGIDHLICVVADQLHPLGVGVAHLSLRSGRR